jgi:hypothetical protein
MNNTYGGASLGTGRRGYDAELHRFAVKCSCLSRPIRRAEEVFQTAIAILRQQ